MTVKWSIFGSACTDLSTHRYPKRLAAHPAICRPMICPTDVPLEMPFCHGAGIRSWLSLPRTPKISRKGGYAQTKCQGFLWLYLHDPMTAVSYLCVRLLPTSDIPFHDDGRREHQRPPDSFGVHFECLEHRHASFFIVCFVCLSDKRLAVSRTPSVRLTSKSSVFAATPARSATSIPIAFSSWCSGLVYGACWCSFPTISSALVSIVNAFWVGHVPTSHLLSTGDQILGAIPNAD